MEQPNNTFGYLSRSQSDRAVDMTVGLRSQHIANPCNNPCDQNTEYVLPSHQLLPSLQQLQNVPLQPGIMSHNLRPVYQNMDQPKFVSYLEKTPDSNTDRDATDLFVPLHNDLNSSHAMMNNAGMKPQANPVKSYINMDLVQNVNCTVQNSVEFMDYGLPKASSHPKTLKCGDCGACFTHECKGGGFKCNLCKKSFDSDSRLQEHVVVHSLEKWLSCENCTEMFTLQSELDQHRKERHRMESAEQPFSENDNAKSSEDKKAESLLWCVECNESFSTLNKLTKHRKAHQSDSKGRSCEFCGKKFSKMCNLSRHRRIHTGLKPFKCEICGKGFIEGKELIIHKRNHTGERPFECDECGNRFISLSSLTAHKRRHAGEKPHKCDECGKCFFTSTYLKHHMKLHSGKRYFDDSFVCDECGKFFTTSSNLKSHKKFHTGVKPHQCDQCNKAFTKAGDLRVHYRIHTGEKPYQCSDCGKCFSTASNFSAHRRIHSKHSLTST